ncbi:MAG: hypothetical protein Q4P13_11170 [Psychrobacter sp.]|nr:hypothetical protein [Psychrobacter sp.]
MSNRKPTVYLDQNVLTELRIKKIFSGDYMYVQLLKLFMSGSYSLIYSDVTLEEIYKIDNELYIKEHLSLLKFLRAVYWNNIFIPQEHDVESIYKIFVKSRKDKNSQNLNNSAEKFIKRMNGIDIGITTKETFEQMLEEAVKIPFSYLKDKVPQFGKVSKPIERTVINFTRNYFSSISNELIDFNPVEFRKCMGIDNDRLNEIEPEKVMLEIIKNFYNYDPNLINIFQLNGREIETKIEFLFLLLNWVGYYSDKFQNDSSKKGFHSASMRDAKHAGTAWHFDYLISSDFKFRKKTKACYSFIGSETQVLSIEEFLNLQKL